MTQTTAPSRHVLGTAVTLVLTLIGTAQPAGAAPDVAVNPTSLSSQASQGEQSVETMDVLNNGAGEIGFTLGEAGVLAQAPGHVQPGTRTPPQAAALEAADRLTAAVGPNCRISFHRGTGVASHIRLDSPLAVPATVADPAHFFMDAWGDIFGIRDAEAELLEISREVDHLGVTHVRYRQVHGQIPVFGTDLRVHLDAGGEIIGANGIFIPDVALNTIPRLTVADAVSAATAAVYEGLDFDPALPVWADRAELTVFRTGLVQGLPGRDHLAYEVEIRNDVDVREYLFIDAHKGHVVEQYTGIHDALFRRLYEVSMTNQIWAEGDAFPGSLDQWQQNEVAAAGHTFNFFFNAFDRDSYDAAGHEMLTINNDPSISCPNARWTGATASYCTGTASDDVVAHEWGHAYTEYTNNLIYAWQAGALNESFSDIWGETIDLINGYEDGDDDQSLRTACGSSDRWRMGEDASAFGGAIRDMWDPTCDGDPGKVSDTQYYCLTGDSGGVHTNSGVPNRLYALLVDGGTFNGQEITSIGFVKAAHIMWRAQAVYHTAVSDFAEHADAVEASCADLMGVDLEGLSTGAPVGLSGEQITTADCQEVAEAVLAVELRTEPCPGTFAPLLDPNAPSLCGAGTTMVSAYSEDFESGLSAWTMAQTPSNPATWTPRDWVLNSSLPSGRSGSAAFGADPIIGDCVSDLENGIMSMTSPVVSIPAGAQAPIQMAFDHWVSMENLWDGGRLTASVNSGAFTQVPSSAFTFNPYNTSLNTLGAGNDNPLAGTEAFTGADGGSVTGSWGQSQIDLSAIGVGAGDTVELRWELSADGCNGWHGWFVDDVQVYTCESVPMACDSPTDIPWLSASPLDGVLGPGASQSIDVTFDSNGLSLGTYQANLCVSSNDPVTPLLEVPVSFEVIPSSVIFTDGFETGDLSAWGPSVP